MFTDTTAELNDALAKGGNVILSADIVLEEPIEIPAGVTATLNLGGKVITGTAHKSVGAVLKNEGTLTINGGTYSEKPEAFVADGYEAVQSGSTWTVSAK